MSRKWHAFFILLLLAAPVAAQAQFYYSENPGNTGGSFGNNTIYVTITGYYGPDGSVTIPGIIDGYTVTTIGENAFLEESGVTNIKIPPSVTSIGESAFWDSGLTDLTIPGTVTNIGPEAFGQCASLTNAILAEGVSSIGASAFYSCWALANATIPGSVIGIGPYAFNFCTSLTNATISEGVVSVGDDAFNSCTSLISVTIPGSVTNIGEGAFSGSGLTNATIPDGVINIGGSAFSDTSLTSVTIPASAANIGMDAFASCSSLTGITVDSQNSVYSSIGGVLFDKSATTLIQAPGGLRGSFSVPPGVTRIAEAAFYHCTSLTNVTIPNSVTNIGVNAFYNCGRLGSVTIGSGVISIGADAFYDCGLASVYFMGNSPTVGSEGFFADNATVYYLPGTTGWGSTFAGLPTALWHLPYPVILNNGPNFGVQTNAFGFTISWATNKSVVVEATSELAGSVWTPLQTNTLTNGSFSFSEPLQTSSSARFYRISSP